jgi:hypothetical protein
MTHSSDDDAHLYKGQGLKSTTLCLVTIIKEWRTDGDRYQWEQAWNIPVRNSFRAFAYVIGIRTCRLPHNYYVAALLPNGMKQMTAFFLSSPYL